MRAYLMHGECLDRMKDIKDKSIDLVLCDLPYGVTDNDWDILIPFDLLWAEYNRICKGHVILYSAQPFTTDVISSNRKHFRYAWVWEKNRCTGFQNAKKMPMRKTEDILVFGRGPYNPQGLRYINKVSKNGKKTGGGNLGERRNAVGMRDPGSTYVQEYENYPNNILRFDLDVEKHHPTQKPILLNQYLINTYSNVGDVVLDNTMGVGSTGVAAALCGRLFVGIEQKKEYYDIAVSRVSEARIKRR